MYFVEKIKGTDYFRQFDYVLFLSILALSVIGIVVLSSATFSMNEGASIMKTQVVSLILGIIASLIISVIDYNSLKQVATLLYLITVGLLLFVLYAGVGYEEVGSKSWLIIPLTKTRSVSFQPSELAKITLVIIVSTLLDKVKEGKDIKKNIFKMFIFFLVIVGLILMQPDYGMAIVVCIAFIVIIYIAGIKYKYILFALGTLLIATPFLWLFALNDERKKRILEFILPGHDPSGASYQLDKAEIAIGSGRIWGSGLYKGIQTQTPPNIGGVPVRESDMIFTVIGEELGFIGSVLIIALIVFIILRCIYIARNARDNYGSFLTIGLTGMLAYQFIQNIGMCLRLLPVTGLPLPFVSAGGSAMITNYISIGIILSVSMRRRKTLFLENSNI